MYNVFVNIITTRTMLGHKTHHSNCTTRSHYMTVAVCHVTYSVEADGGHHGSYNMAGYSTVPSVIVWLHATYHDAWLIVAINQTLPVRYLERVELKRGRISRCGLFTHLLDEITLAHSNSRKCGASSRNSPLNDVMSHP